jgi:glutamate synthase domain-containing protein 1
MTEQTNEQVEQQVAPEGAQPVTLGLNDLQTMLTVIDTVTQRGAFKAPELAAVGILYNRIQQFLEAAKAAQQAQAPAEEESKEPGVTA